MKKTKSIAKKQAGPAPRAVTRTGDDGGGGAGAYPAELTAAQLEEVTELVRAAAAGGGPGAAPGLEVIVVAAATDGSSDIHVVLNALTEQDGGQYLVRLSSGRAGAATILHQDALVFPLPLPSSPALEVPEAVQVELSAQLVVALAAASEVEIADADIPLHAEALRSGTPDMPLLRHGTQRGLFDWVKGLFEGGPKPAVVSHAPAGSEEELNARLLATAKAQVHVLSSKTGPGGGNLACVWAVDRIFQIAFGKRLTRSVNTGVIDAELAGGNGRLVTLADARPGHIIISPTGTGSGHGHIGILGEGGKIYSNSSSHARWEQNHTLDTWQAHYVGRKKMDLHIYQVKASLAGLRSLPLARTDDTRSGGYVPDPVTRDSGAALAPATGSARGAETLARIDRYWQGVDARNRSRANTRGEKITLLAEGDSWFDFKIQDDVIDWLRHDHGYEIENVAAAGACLYEMAYGPDNDGMFDFLHRDPSQLEEVVRLIRQKRPRALLLSGAGNDFVGPEFIMLIHHALASPTGVNALVARGVFEQEIEPAYRRIIETANAAAAREGLALPILVHGYDYAFPDGRAALNLLVKKVGPWMKPSFDMKGYAPGSGQDLARRRALVRELIDTVYRMHERLAASFPNVHIVDVRGTLPDIRDWHDELHPTGDGFRKVAVKFHEVLARVLGGSGPRAVDPGPGPRPGGGPGVGGGGSTGDRLSLQAALEGSGGGDPALPEPVRAPAGPADPAAGAPCPPAPAMDDDMAGYVPSSLEEESAESLFARARDAENREQVRRWVEVNPARALDFYEQLRLQALDDTGDVAAPVLRSAGVTAAWAGLEGLLGEALRWPRTGDAAVRQAPPTLAQLLEQYEELFRTCRIRPEHASTIAWYVTRIRNGRARYEALEEDLTIPWKFLAVTHSLECSNDFSKHLHNGDPLTGRTVRVPAGRLPDVNPPYTFTQSAHDAMKMKNYHQQTDWSVPAMLYRWEKYNGWGYRSRGIYTPYLWSFSEHYTKGKFTADGVYNPEAVSRQAGAAVLLKAIENL